MLCFRHHTSLNILQCVGRAASIDAATGAGVAASSVAHTIGRASTRSTGTAAVAVGAAATLGATTAGDSSPNGATTARGAVARSDRAEAAAEAGLSGETEVDSSVRHHRIPVFPFVYKIFQTATTTNGIESLLATSNFKCN